MGPLGLVTLIYASPHFPPIQVSILRLVLPASVSLPSQSCSLPRICLSLGSATFNIPQPEPAIPRHCPPRTAPCISEATPSRALLQTQGDTPTSINLPRAPLPSTQKPGAKPHIPPLPTLCCLFGMQAPSPPQGQDHCGPQHRLICFFILPCAQGHKARKGGVGVAAEVSTVSEGRLGRSWLLAPLRRLLSGEALCGWGTGDLPCPPQPLMVVQDHRGSCWWHPRATISLLALVLPPFS